MKLWHSDLRLSDRDQARMTPAEFAVACADPEQIEQAADSRPPGMSVEDYAAWWRALTPEQRLERARERWR